jgi:hypothetical protein
MITLIIHPCCVPIHQYRSHDIPSGGWVRASDGLQSAGISLYVKRGGWPLGTEK